VYPNLDLHDPSNDDLLIGFDTGSYYAKADSDNRYLQKVVIDAVRIYIERLHCPIGGEFGIKDGTSPMYNFTGDHGELRKPVEVYGNFLVDNGYSFTIDKDGIRLSTGDYQLIMNVSGITLTGYAKTSDLTPYAKTADLPIFTTYALRTDLTPFATQSFVSTAIAALVNSAPAAFDTLRTDRRLE